MFDDDDFKPKLGRIRSRGSKSGRKFLHQVIIASNLARGGAGDGGGGARKSSFTGSRIGRGAGVGHVLANRNRYSAFHRRRVVIKSRIPKLAGKGLNRARVHLRYIQRDGLTREGEPGELYSDTQERTDGKAFLERSNGDRHQFRFIVSAEDGVEYDDLKSFTRRLMARVEEDLDSKLDWVAVDHYNTGHPHTHVLVRGRDDRGKDLIIARDYLTAGMRERAAEIVSLDFGPRSDIEIEEQLRREVEQERLTSIDCRLIREMDETGSIMMTDSDAFQQTLRMGRLQKLRRLGLAEELRPGEWRLESGLEDALRRMGERSDIIKTVHREVSKKNIARSPGDYAIHDPSDPHTKPVVGRIITRGLSDEINDRHYLIVDGVDGCTHYIDIGRGDATEPTPGGGIVRITPKNIGPRQVDQTVVEVAAANGGQYTIDQHLRYDPRATQDFAETHVRRLEAIRTIGGIAREPNGAWIIASDHLDRVVEYERQQARSVPVIVEKLSHLALDQQIGSDGATWLDRELVSDHPAPIRDSGFGRQVREAQARRRQWLLTEGLAYEERDRIIYRVSMMVTLRRRELARVAGKLSEQLGLAHVETRSGEPVEGRLRCSLQLASGKYAVIEMSHEFALVPWRPVLERHIGKQVSGLMRDDGVSWTLGRQKRLGIS
ncbi:relaxase/mobilization nuclease RlxS [Chelativorans alearense]|uniref:relaxase/mobilization nuclease RlxS n=1 Tax=Chelativorans alearense TaxID=2681495 RepID=UPI0013D256E2|nr:relaxase/mobilization nuclease RlxS [Chelativorans alearense]